MRAADLLGLPVVGAAGEPLGQVLDVRLVQDGPLLGGYAALRVQGLVVGHHRLAAHLGYDRTGVGGPYLVRRAVQWWTRHNAFLPWDAVTVDAHQVSARTDALQPVPPL